jgi:hypothetical protein
MWSQLRFKRAARVLAAVVWLEELEPVRRELDLADLSANVALNVGPPLRVGRVRFGLLLEEVYPRMTGVLIDESYPVTETAMRRDVDGAADVGVDYLEWATSGDVSLCGKMKFLHFGARARFAECRFTGKLLDVVETPFADHASQALHVVVTHATVKDIDVHGCVCELGSRYVDVGRKVHVVQVSLVVTNHDELPVAAEMALVVLKTRDDAVAAQAVDGDERDSKTRNM